jgi:uncharacterized repeat protein (TIGR03803 family)
MPSKTLTALWAMLLILMSNAANAQTETILHTFLGGNDGTFPNAGVIFDAAGNLYGTAQGGGTSSSCGINGCGIVFELSPVSGGGWTKTVLYDFAGGNDGIEPIGALIFDGAGNLYGTTAAGGSGACEGGCGIVFELSPITGGGWSEKVLYTFAGGEDGIEPTSSLVFDASGNLYGTTVSGGVHRYGTVFQLKPGANGSWSERVLHNFAASAKDGSSPECNLVFDAEGNLYGTTDHGGAYNFYGGMIFELTPTLSGPWTERGVHSFGNGQDGVEPVGGLTLDAAGNLYGATAQGGPGKNGTIFELSPTLSGGWTERILYSFRAFSSGGGPNGNLVFDAAGNLYGETYEGGLLGCVRDGCGTAFKLSLTAGGDWQETVLNSFSANIDGGFPLGGVILDSSGNLYGTTGGESGTAAYYGTVFEITQ